MSLNQSENSSKYFVIFYDLYFPILQIAILRCRLGLVFVIRWWCRNYPPDIIIVSSLSKEKSGEEADSVSFLWQKTNLENFSNFLPTPNQARDHDAAKWNS